MEIKDLGVTYLADRLNKDGGTVSSALDHIYTSTDPDCKTTKLEEGSLDHLVIVAEINYKQKPKARNKTFTRRDMKHFTQESLLNTPI